MAKVLGQGLNHTDSASAYPSCISGTRRDSADQRRMWPRRGSLNDRGVAYVCVHLQTLSNILCQLYACTTSRCKLQPSCCNGPINLISIFIGVIKKLINTYVEKTHAYRIDVELQSYARNRVYWYFQQQTMLSIYSQVVSNGKLISMMQWLMIIFIDLPNRNKSQRFNQI